MDYRIRATAAQGTLRAIATLTTLSARAAQTAHRAGPLSAAAMGRTLSAAALLGVDLKQGGRVTVELAGGGPLGRVMAENRGDALRARVDNPEADLALRDDGKLAVGQAVGQDGFFTVRRQDSEGNTWESRTRLTSGEIGDDLTRFYFESEQVRSAVGLGVLVGTDGLVAASGGLVVQALPGSEDVLEWITERFQRLDRLSHRLADGKSPEALVESVLPPDSVKWFEREPLAFRCQCSRERSGEILQNLPKAELEALVADDGAEVVCNYCRTGYQFSRDELESWLTVQ